MNSKYMGTLTYLQLAQTNSLKDFFQYKCAKMSFGRQTSYSAGALAAEINKMAISQLKRL